MTLTDKLMIAAIFLGPIVAVQLDKFIERRRENLTKKRQIYYILMTTRGAPVSAQHVEALNSIDIVFYDNEKVKTAWKTLLDHFANYPNEKDVDYQVKLSQAGDKAKDLLGILLCEMGKVLGYKFDSVHLKRNVYIPRGHSDFFMDTEAIRKAFLDILNGRKSLPVQVINQDK